MSRYLQKVDIYTLVSKADNCAEKVSIFESIIQSGLDCVVPLRFKKIHPSDPPWVNPTFKVLIEWRQKAFAEDNQPKFRFLRNRVNRERKTCRARYYESKVRELKEWKPSAWWNEGKKLSGKSSAVRDAGKLTRSLQHINAESNCDLANLINNTFLSPVQDFTPLLSLDCLIPLDPPASPPIVISAHAVYLSLSSLNCRKASGPDGIPAWLLKENADILAETVTDILNYSYAEGRLPPTWKAADVVPIPKQKPVKEVNKHLRPISLTPILSKVAEEFVF